MKKVAESHNYMSYNVNTKRSLIKQKPNYQKNCDMKSFSIVWRKLWVSQLRRAKSNIISGVISTVAQAAAASMSKGEKLYN